MTVAVSVTEATQPSAEQSRDQRGRFTSLREPTVLFEIVREVALIAARRDPDRLKDPRTVSQAAWNSARHSLASRYGAPPQANEICRQLSDRDGKPWPWRELLEIIFDPARDPKKTWEERLSEPERVIRNEHVYYALNYVASRRGVPSLRHPFEYEETREELLREARRGRALEALNQRLPSRGQIEFFCGSWERALEIAGHRLRLIRDEGEMDGPPRENDAEPSREIPRPGQYTRVQVLEAVRAFVQWLPLGTPATQKRWAAFERGRTEVPSFKVIKRHGGLELLLREAAHPAWRARAEEWDTQAATAGPASPPGRPPSGLHEQVLALVVERGKISRREIEVALDLPPDKVRYSLRYLKKKGLIDPTHPHPQAKNQRYRPAVRSEATE